MVFPPGFVSKSITVDEGRSSSGGLTMQGMAPSIFTSATRTQLKQLIRFGPVRSGPDFRQWR